MTLLLRAITLISLLSVTIAPAKDLSTAIKTWDTRALFTTTGTPAKLLLPEGTPAVLVHLEPEGAELRLSLNTGANRSAVAPAAVAALSALTGRATKGRVGAASTAGTWVDDAGTLIPQLTLRVGEVSIPLSRVPVGPGAENFDGTLGQVVFRSGGGYVIDFDRMTLEILPAVGRR